MTRRGVLAVLLTLLLSFQLFPLAYADDFGMYREPVGELTEAQIPANETGLQSEVPHTINEVTGEVSQDSTLNAAAATTPGAGENNTTRDADVTDSLKINDFTNKNGFSEEDEWSQSDSITSASSDALPVLPIVCSSVTKAGY